MTDDVNNSDLVVRQYLLGGLAPPQREEIERRVFTDPKYRERVQLVEQELVEEYVDGELPEEERAAFAARLLASRYFRLEVGMLEELKRHAEAGGRAAAAAAGGTDAAPGRFAAWLAALRRFRTPLVATCLALLVVGLAFLLWRTLESRRLDREQLSERARGERIGGVVARLNTPGGDAAAAAALEAMASPATHAELTPGVSRDARDRAEYPSLAPPPGAPYARLRLRLEPAAGGYQSFLARFKTVDNGVRFEADLRPSPEAGAPGLWVTLPLGELPDGDYQIELSGRDSSGRLEELPDHYYTFRIVRRGP